MAADDRTAAAPGKVPGAKGLYLPRWREPDHCRAARKSIRGRADPNDVEFDQSRKARARLAVQPRDGHHQQADRAFPRAAKWMNAKPPRRQGKSAKEMGDRSLLLRCIL